jgi:arsenite methyltransferase
VATGAPSRRCEAGESHPCETAASHSSETAKRPGSRRGGLYKRSRAGPETAVSTADGSGGELARRNASEAGVENVEFRKGYLEQLPLPDASVDVVISNCVVNLSGDKPKVLAEAAGVLRAGDRFAISLASLASRLDAVATDSASRFDAHSP